MNHRYWLALFPTLALVALSACDQPATKDEAAAPSTEILSSSALDETGQCGQIRYLVEGFPAESMLRGLPEAYRGCDSLISAQLIYANTRGDSVNYSLMVLTAEQAGLSATTGSWSALIDSNRQAMEALLETYRASAESTSPRAPRALPLPNNVTGVLFYEAGEWSLAAILNERHALRIEAAGDEWQGYNTDEAARQMQLLLDSLNFDAL
jgi:hypothetical protein